MKVVIALKCASYESCDGLWFLQALCRNRGQHEIILALESIPGKSIEPIRAAFDEVLPQRNIRIWYSPADSSRSMKHEKALTGEIAGMIGKSFLLSLKPDVIVLSEALVDSLALTIPVMPAGVGLARLWRDSAEPVKVARLEWLSGKEKQIVTLDETAHLPIDQQALLAIEKLETWQTELETATPAIPERPDRKKLAYVSPLPPEHSGISDYSAELLPELSRYFEIDVVVAQTEVSDNWIRKNCTVRNVLWFIEHAESYDRVIYHIGNSHFHFHMFDLMKAVPGVIVLHDFFLSDSLAYRDRSSYIATLYRSHGYPALQKLIEAEKKGGNVVGLYPCNFDILQRATGVIVHSEYTKALAALWYGSPESERCTVIPLLRAPALQSSRTEARRRLGIKDDTLMVCSFGMPDAYKLSHLLLEAWLASELVRDGKCMLLFVGEAPDNGFCAKLRQSIEQSGSKGRIRMTGWVTMEDYRLYLNAADIGVQLRTLSRGESSASALDCMNYGLATIVNANGSMAELPETCVMMLPDEVKRDQLTAALETLRENDSLRLQLGSNAKTYITTERSPGRIAEQYSSAIERSSLTREAICFDLLRQITSRHEQPVNNAELLTIAKSVADTFPASTARKQLLIDISALATEDLKTGIQRVVRSVVKELLDRPPEGFRIEPVYLVHGEQGFYYRYARRFTMTLLGGNENQQLLLTDDPIAIQQDDKFLVLDLCHNVRHCATLFESFRNNGCQVYFVVYDLLPLLFPQFFPPGVSNIHDEWMMVAAQCDGAICISRAVSGDVLTWLDKVQPFRCRPFSIGWFPLGADIENSLPTKGLPEGFDADLQKFAASPTILMVGTIEPRKGHDQVVKACELLWMTGMKLNLVIVGKKGWMVEGLLSRLEKHKQLNRRLFWYQGISDEALNQLYEIADGMVMASEGEGFGLPLIEAAQHNCPVLARDLPVFREVAGQHAAWFSGNSPLKLAYALKSWIDALNNGSAPLSTGMPWTTWKESSARIVGLLTDPQDANWIYRWKPDPANEQKNKAAREKNAVKSPKCIAVDLTLVLPGGENGGAKVFLLELLRLLAEMKPETQFIVLTRQSSHKELACLDRPNLRRIMILPERAGENAPKTTLDRFTVWMKRTGKRWEKSIKKRLKSRKPVIERRLSDLGVDLFYSPFASLQNAETGIPAVCTIHDLQYKSYPEFFDPEEAAKRDWLFMDACQRATIMAAISDYSRKSAITHGMLAPERIRTIHHQIGRRLSSGNGQEITLLAHLGLEKKSYFLYPANFWRHKNHELLLTAFEMAAREGLKSEFRLVCTGAPTQRQKELIEKTQLMGLGERVIFTGYVTNDELSGLLSNCTALIFPSLYEGFGLPVIEAMAAGVPVACSNTRALPEITAGAALLFDPNSPEQIAWAMITLSNDASMRERLVQAGHKQANRFSDQTQMAMEYWELFETALNSDFRHGASQERRP